jgi:hypothetical protein
MTEADYIQSLQKLWPDQDTEAAQPLLLVEEAIGAFPRSAKLLCMKGDLIQQSDANGYSLDDAAACYERAASIDPSCAEAFEALGFFFDVISEDLERAESAFRTAITLGAGPAAYAGLARVRAERGGDVAEIIAFLDACAHATDEIVLEMRAEIEAGDWSPR